MKILREEIMPNSVVLYESEETSMGGGTWTEQITCKRRKDGTYSLRARKTGDDGTFAPAGRTKLSSPQDFLSALSELFDMLGAEIDVEVEEGVCARLAELDVAFSVQVSQVASTRALG